MSTSIRTLSIETRIEKPSSSPFLSLSMAPTDGSHRLTSWQAQIKQVETFYGIDKSRVCWWQKSASQVSLLLRIRTRQGKTPGNADQSTVAVGCCITRAAPTWRKKVESQRERLYWMLLHGYILTWATVYWALIIEISSNAMNFIRRVL